MNKELVVLILLCVCCALLGGVGPKPVGWVVVGLSVLALLIALLGGIPMAGS